MSPLHVTSSAVFPSAIRAEVCRYMQRVVGMGRVVAFAQTAGVQRRTTIQLSAMVGEMRKARYPAAV